MCSKVKPLTFRQWATCVTIGAMLSAVVMPPGICWCAECGCAVSVTQSQATPAVADVRYCCKPPPPLPCSEKPDSPCPCQCSDTQKGDTILPETVLPVKKTNARPVWDSVHFAGFADVSGVSSSVASCIALPIPHVPLHVLLCVFLN